MKLTGIWLPIITPFKENKIDYISYKRLIDYYADKGISGFIPLGTTGEVPVLEDYEFEELIDKTLEYNAGRLPVYVGAGGNHTAKVIKKVKLAGKYEIQGILSVCPYYNKPGQEGIYRHFKSISEETDLDMILYNIPYRTGVNMENETIYRLAELKNISALKDSCGNMKQTMSLLMNPPKDFSILTGEDILLFNTLTLGGQGGILASAHIHTDKFLTVYNQIKENNIEAALAAWKELYPLIPLLFQEPNPAPVKYCLKQKNFIDSDEVRLPLTGISRELQLQLKNYL